MIGEPYRWVEAIRNRREYLEDQLRNTSPVAGLVYEDGLLLLTTTPGPRKLFEVYDRIAFAAVGHPADIEKLRKAVIDAAHIEGFNLSSADVSLQKLVSFGLGPSMKSAFDEVSRSPYLARVLMAELDPEGENAFCAIDADGSFASSSRWAAVGGDRGCVEAVVEHLKAETGGEALPLRQALSAALRAWAAGRLQCSPEEEAESIEELLGKALKESRVEAAVLDRSLRTKSKFRLLKEAELAPVLAPYAV